MKKPHVVLPFLLLLLSGCSKSKEDSSVIPVVYGIIAVLSTLIVIGYLTKNQKKEIWFTFLFSSVLAVNIGYFWLSVSDTLSSALMANRLAYLGSVFLPMTMLIIILNVTKLSYPKWLPVLLTVLCSVVFLIAASQGFSTLYYEKVTIDTSNGFTVLDKVYGPLHPVYMVYLMGYLAVTISVIIYAISKKKIDCPAHSVILALAVFVNLGVWFIEQVSNIEFEFLSISYIICELFLIGLHTVISENEKLKAIIKASKSSLSESQQSRSTISLQDLDPEKINNYLKGMEELTNTEKMIFDKYIARSSTKEILTALNIKENTLKFHNKNIYGKLGVSSRKELQEIYGIIKNYNSSTTEKQ